MITVKHNKREIFNSEVCKRDLRVTMLSLKDSATQASRGLRTCLAAKLNGIALVLSPDTKNIIQRGMYK